MKKFHPLAISNAIDRPKRRYTGWTFLWDVRWVLLAIAICGIVWFSPYPHHG
jgi:hypothetical protein